jgi:hypothetical protein
MSTSGVIVLFSHVVLINSINIITEDKFYGVNSK